MLLISKFQGLSDSYLTNIRKSRGIEKHDIVEG
jgi:hypothetical protein